MLCCRKRMEIRTGCIVAWNGQGTEDTSNRHYSQSARRLAGRKDRDEGGSPSLAAVQLNSIRYTDYEVNIPIGITR